MSSTPSGPPITRFKRSRRESTSGDVSVSSGQGPQWDIDWEQVVRQEPEQVVAWIVYLHRSNETRPCMYVVNAAEWFVASEDYKPGCGQWKAYEETDLAGVLMDFLCEPDMFSLDDNTSKVCDHCCILYRLCVLTRSLRRIWSTAITSCRFSGFYWPR